MPGEVYEVNVVNIGEAALRENGLIGAVGSHSLCGRSVKEGLESAACRLNLSFILIVLEIYP